MSEKVPTTEEAGQRMSAMWGQIASNLEGLAIEYAATGEWEAALRVGRAADVAIWQATGEGECISLRAALGEKECS